MRMTVDVDLENCYVGESRWILVYNIEQPEGLSQGASKAAVMLPHGAAFLEHFAETWVEQLDQLGDERINGRRHVYLLWLLQKKSHRARAVRSPVAKVGESD